MRVGTLYAVLRLETGAFDAALAKSEGKMATFFGLVSAAAVLAASALAVVVGGAIYAAATFEKHMTEATAIMGELSEDLRKKLSDAARQVAKETTFSANQAADAYYYLASAGYTAEQAIALLPVVARFAQASLIDMAEATSLLADTQTVFGLRSEDFVQNAENMVRVSDVLTAAAIESNATMEELAKALTTKAGASFRLVGKDIEEATAVLMVFANQGVKGAMAGTALSIVLRELQTKAIKNADAFAAMGIAVFDANGEMRNMADIIYDFEQALAGMSDEEKKMALIQLGLTDRSNAFVLALIGMSGKIREYEALLREAGGTTQTVAEKQLDNLISQTIIMWHKITDVAITIGQKLMPALTDVVRGIGNWFDANNELAGQITDNVLEAIRRFVLFLENRVWPILKRIGGIIADVAHQIHMWAVRLEGLSGAYGPVDKLLAAFSMGLDKLLDSFENNTVYLALLSIATGFRILGAVIMAHPLVAAFTAIITAVGLLQQAWNTNFGGIQEKTKEFMDWFNQNVAPKIDEAFTWLEINVFPIVEDFFTWLGTDGLQLVKDAWKWITEEGIPDLVDAFDFLIENTAEPLIGFFERTADAVGLTEDAFDDLKEWWDENGEDLGDAVFGFASVWVELWSLVLTIISHVVPGIIYWLGLLIGFLAGPLAVQMDETETDWGDTFTSMAEAVDWFTGEIDRGFTLLGVLWDDFLALIDKVQHDIENAFIQIEDAINGFIDTVQDAIDKILEFLGLKTTAENSARTDAIVNFFQGGGLPPGGLPPPPPSGGGGGGSYVDTTPLSGFQFAQGTVNFRGGMALVGEEGPELVTLPRGANVYPNDETMAALRGGQRGGPENHVHLTVQGLVQAKDEYDVLRQLRRASRFLPYGTPIMETE